MEGIEIIYDGECPFCSRYVMMTRLRDTVGRVRLVDARSNDPVVSKIKELGFDLNEGMVARYRGQNYFGADCIHLLSILSSKSGTLNRLSSTLFSNRYIATISYPVLRAGRNATLRIMGSRPIG
ncbi:DCC1-like thiol-disulfide oxidoreductase family protein [uncultured Tateyamaria sp.]|uniref:DCC1-like thiol-disulfide oxidoreductase family protein n=1 Tax=uncultured Tateyamaria sp. TaxID=455651 RepID=UPI00344DC696